MSKTAKKSSSTDSELPFEKALARLESLIQGMDSDQVPLDELIKNYEEGISLYGICEKRLDEAQGRIDLIRKKRDGSVVMESFGEKKSDLPPEKSSKQVEKNNVTSTVNDVVVEDGELF